MEADVLNALKSRVAYLPGGRDHDSHLLIIFQLPSELQPWTRRYIEVSTRYLLSSLSKQTLNNGLIAIVDAQKCSWRQARDQIKLITQLLDENLIKIFAIRTDAFSMQNCAKTYKKGEPIIISKSRLNKFFNLAELPREIGGLQSYNHDEWLQNRVKIDEFRILFDSILTSIKCLKENLANTSTMRSSEIDQTIKICGSTYADVQKSIKTLLDNGNMLISHIDDCRCLETLLSQDILDAKETIKSMLNESEREQTDVCNAWNELEKCLGNARDFTQLEEGVSYVTNWILSTAESLLNGQLKVGYDVQSAEKLRLDHEILEFQCWKTYGFYGELLYKIDNFPGCKDSFAYKDLLSQRDFMDFVCRSFANRLERRRNLLITSVRFFRLVAEYFQRTSNVFESLLHTQKENVDNFELAKVKLEKIKDSQQSLGNIEKELVKEGEKLSDVLSMPIKDALGRDIDVDYSEDIANLREVLDAAKTRFKIFSDSMDLQKLTLEQITHIHSCEKDAETAVKWVESLYKVMLKSHTHVGCNVSEIQNQKDEHQAFQETAKGTFNYGIQLLNAALALRQSCKLSPDSNLGTIEHLKKMWKNLHAVSQEQMTRLRVSAVFYRSVDEHCVKLEQLKTSVLKLKDVDDEEKKIFKLRKYLAVRERLLVEVGRMVRLGRLLRTRLKEPFVLNNDLENMSSEENIIALPTDNSIASDSISAKLIEVSRVAESLDTVLHETQDGLSIFESTMHAAMPSTSLSVGVERKVSSANTSDDWNSSLKSSTEDESFITASEYTPSRSSSYHTASECRGTSPWCWNESGAERSSTDFDSSDHEHNQPIKSLRGTSSANVSFDDSEHSFRSPVSFSEQTDSDTAAPPLPPKNASPVVEFSEIVHSENKIYTIFESPTSSPSEIEEDGEGVLKVAEPYLQVDRAANCIEKTLDAFGSRQLEISDVWEHWNISKEITIILETIMAENSETLALTAKIEDELYPILATSEEQPSELIRFVDNKLKTVLNEIHQAESELSARIDKIDKLEAKDQVSNEKIVQVKNNLNSIKTKLFTISADYSELVDVILVFLRSYQEVYESIRDYFTAKDQPMAENVKSLINDYETFKNNTMEHFRSLLVQSEKIIDRIKMQEPPGAKEHDTDKVISLLERLRSYFESNAASENSELKRQYFITEFEKMLTDLNENITDLQLQFTDMQGKFGESAAASKVASLSYEYFERNVDLLNKRIENFIISYKNSTISYPDTKPYVNGELNKLQDRWDEFKNRSLSLKNSLSLAQQYFSLLDTVETRYHKTYTFLVNSVNIRKEELRSSNAAFQLIDEIEKYVVDNKQTQINDLNRISQLSVDIFGEDKTENLRADNLFIFQSFEKMKSDIVDVVKDLKAKEDPVAMINEIDKNILVIESVEVKKSEHAHEIVPVVEECEAPKFLRFLESSEVIEGESFAYECVVKGTPEPSIQWLKYNNPIVESQKQRISSSAGKCRLQIENVSKSDAAVYSCIATNNSGTSQSTANLIVNDAPKEETHLAPPTFVRLLQNAYANERSSFEFNCLVAGNPLPTVQWFRNDNCVDNNASYNITYNNGLASLQIPNVKVEDQGIFTVKASNEVGHNECSAIFSVEAVEQHQKPVVKYPLSNVMSRVGQKIKLETVVSGNPRPEIYWIHNGKQLSDHDVNLQNDDGRITLTIPEASSNHSGIYRLTARNVAGEASTECFVTVEQIAEAPKPSGAVKPSVHLPLKDTSVFEGKSVQLDCIIVGQPEPEVIWLQNENPIKESNDIQLYFEGDSCTLLINEAFIEDAGVYKVVAINAAGETSSECRVTVTPLNIAEPLVRPTSDRLVSSEMPPKFEKLLTDNFANEGETIELECGLASGPLPEIKWFLNNKEITPNDRIQSVSKEDGTLKLIIANVLPDDKGVYTVKATNSTGVAKCFSHLIVKSTANSSDAQLFKPETEEKQICPTFKELFADRSVGIEDSTKFECIVYGKPTPKIRWFFNEQPVQGRDFLVSTSGERQVLIIPSVKHHNVGKISCFAENEAGKATCVANLTLNTTGVPLASEDQFTTQEDVSGSSFVTMQKHISTTTKQSSNVFGNGPPQSQFHSTSEQIDSSFKKIGDAPAKVSESKKFEEFRESSSEPPQTFAQKILNFTKNDSTEKHESIIANSGQISTGKPVRRNIAPRFVTPLIGKIVDQGVDVVLEGIVDGHPSPSVEITKNGDVLPNVPGVSEIYYNLNKINIKLFNVMTKDAGRYSAIARNDAGSATSTADLVVKKSIFPPVFGRRLQAQVVKKGERVIMDVEITGTPEPQVSWFKNDQPVNKVMASEYKISQLGICYKLIIENVTVQDTGKYMVKAVNSGGEAQSIADFLVVESQPDRMVEITKTTVFSDLPVNQPRSDHSQIPSQNGMPKDNYTAHQEVSTQAQLGSSTESKVILETTRTTSATMRLEHKPNFPDLPVMFSQRTQTPTIPLVSEGTSTSSEFRHEVKSQSGSTQTQPEPVIKPQAFTPQSVPFPFTDTVDAPVQIAQPEPIKKSALNFFENNLDNLPQLNEKKYTRFEDAMKSSKTYVHKQYEVKDQFQSKLNEDLTYFNLVPEPPPEMGFMPKAGKQQPERIVEKVKKLEEVHQSSEVPLSGIVFPQSFKKEEKFEKKEFISKTSVATSPFLHQKPVSPVPPPRPYTPQIHRDQLFTTKPLANRSPSPIPSKEAVNMEKLWTLKVKSPEPFSVHQQQSFSHEQKSSFVAYSSSQTHVQQSQELLPSKEQFVPIQPFASAEQPVQEELPKMSIKDTKSFFEQRIKQEEVKAVPELKAPGLVKQFAKPMVPLIPLNMEPGEAPEICYAPKPVYERKQSYVEKIEKSLEQTIEKEPERIPRGGVRILPARQTPQRSMTPQKFQPAPSSAPAAPQAPTFAQVVINAEPAFPPPIQAAEPLVPQFEQFRKEFKSETFETKKESSTGYRHVPPPSFLQGSKPAEPVALPPMQFELPQQPEPFKPPAQAPFLPKQSEMFTAKPFIPKQAEFVAPPFVPKPAPVFKPEPVISQRPAEVQIPIQKPETPKPFLQQHKPVSTSSPKPFVAAKQKFNEFVSETQGTHSLYKNFVRSEESTHSSESYFQKIEQSKSAPLAQHPFAKQEPAKQQFVPPQETKTTQMMKNISMTNKQIKINEEPITIHYAAEPRVAPSPSRFVKGEFRESDYESDYDARIQPTWRPSSAQSDKMYKPVTPNLPQTPQNFSSQFRTPPPPSSFETPSRMTGPPSRPKFEPIEKVHVHQTKVFKPTPVTPKSSVNNYLENSSQQSNQAKSYYYTTGPQNSTTYYTAVAGQPVHNAIAHETSNTMHMKESTEKSHRVVNITQTRRVISLDGSKKEEKLEPFPYSVESPAYHQRSRVPPPPTPTKFVPGEFRESDYDSELEGARIRSVWTPNQFDSEDMHYRRVQPPSSRSSSVPRCYERVMTPMEFDTGPVIMPTKIKVESPSIKTPQQYFTSALYRDQNQIQSLDRTSSKKYQTKNVTRDDINVQTRYAPQPTLVDHASHQINSMNTAFKTKAHQFMQEIVSDSNQKQQRPILKRPNSVTEGTGPQAYSEESRASQYGTKHVDPDTGIIYFKYDFGYEFGIIFPGEGKKIVGGIRNANQQSEKQRFVPQRKASIEMPIIHEKSNGRASVVSFGATTPIDFEKEKSKKRHSLPSSNYYDKVLPKAGMYQTSDYSLNNADRSGASTPSIVNPQKQGPPKHPPMYITPLKDIAVVNGQTARFECIVQCDPHPQVFWMKNGQVIESNSRTNIEFRNGVCRLTIPICYQDDAGTYECVAQNPLGADSTRAVLMVPGDKRGFRVY